MLMLVLESACSTKFMFSILLVVNAYVSPEV
jgi:hypothetical protein